MTSSVREYEFTAYEAEDMNAGSRVCVGETLTIPDGATVCFTVTDNDAKLSGDCYDNANDRSYQTATIEKDGVEIGNGGQVYAEKYFWVKDGGGNWFVLIEIEQEGTKANYYTFHEGWGVPEPGAELTVKGACNIGGVYYDRLDAGEKLPTPDDDPDCITIEAEDFDAHGFKTVYGDDASGGELVKLVCAGGHGSLNTTFTGPSCVYDLVLHIQDEYDGQSELRIKIDGEFVGTITLDGDGDGRGSNNGGFSEFVIKGVEIPQGAKVEIFAEGDGKEFVRIDKVDFCKVEFRVCDDPDAVKIDFESFAMGETLTTQVDGVTISATGGSGDAMVFDSANPTGGDGDLATQVAQLGNILIISEDGDSSDPDDNAGGGSLTFDFDLPAKVFDIKVIDTEEGGTITATLADGTTQSFEIPQLANGGVGQVVIDLDDVVSLEVAINGSGAIDDLCYVPGQAPPGSLSGRYFCDTNDNDIDDANGDEPGIGGITVTLTGPDGSVVATTTTSDIGNYRFDNLRPGDYTVEFSDPTGINAGKVLVAPNVGDDASDSDAIGDATTSKIEGITVVSGENTPDNDAGVE
ncbi:MAG: SdrD B-like domain-containing protein, partial [Pseudomonadota bacterium]